MTKNARIFEEYLKQQNITLNFIETEEETIAEIRELLDGGIKVRLAVTFNKHDNLVSIYALEFVGGMNQSKRNQLLDLANELNNSYTYFKFVITNDTIQIQSFIPVNDNFEPSTIMRVIFSMFEVMKNEYQNIMRVMWS